jgi:hypothetical protein
LRFILEASSLGGRQARVHEDGKLTGQPYLCESIRDDEEKTHPKPSAQLARLGHLSLWLGI